MSEKLVIFQKIYDLLLWLYPITNRMPKSHRMILGKNMEEVGIALLLVVIKANKARGRERQEYQLELSDHLDQLRLLLRLNKDLKFMSIKQYISGSEKINEIGRMLAGWMKVLL